MADKRDYYEVLGVGRDVTDSELKKVYRQLARQCHPDLHPDDPSAEQRFKEITEAYEVLSNADKRKMYDQYGHAGLENGGMGGGAGFSDVSDILESIFGGMGMGSMFGGGSRAQNPNAPRQGKDLQTAITIDFMEACRGKSETINVQRMETCPDCHGSGSAGNAATEICPDCQGRGSVKVTQRTPFGMIASSKACPHCSGKGRIIKTPCQKCRGAGRIRVNKSINIDIPEGIADGMTMSARGMGDAGINGGPSGDLYININVRSHPMFDREGFDIHCDIPITYTQAVLGDEIVIPTIDGNEKYRISEGTQTGTVLRLRGKGVKRPNRSDRGDQYVRVYVEVPKGLNKKQKELLQEFESSLESKNYAKREGFFKKLKEVFGHEKEKGKA
ncbi:MAG: molecular chaperone DnaJ [Oscillospiraceae bacterium]|nr:molecular chaperone DnaJ [Oscillospiraceae bacterium]